MFKNNININKLVLLQHNFLQLLSFPSFHNEVNVECRPITRHGLTIIITLTVIKAVSCYTMPGQYERRERSHQVLGLGHGFTKGEGTNLDMSRSQISEIQAQRLIRLPILQADMTCQLQMRRNKKFLINSSDNSLAWRLKKHLTTWCLSSPQQGFSFTNQQANMTANV